MNINVLLREGPIRENAGVSDEDTQNKHCSRVQKQVGNEQYQKGVWVVCLFVVELFELFV